MLTESKRKGVFALMAILFVALMALVISTDLNVLSAVLFNNPQKRVIIIYKHDVDDDDIRDLKRIRATVRHDYKIINGIAAEIDEDETGSRSL